MKNLKIKLPHWVIQTIIIPTVLVFVIVVSWILVVSVISSYKVLPTNPVSKQVIKPVTFQIPPGEALMQYYNHEVLTARIEGKKHVLKVYGLNTDTPNQPRYIITYP